MTRLIYLHGLGSSGNASTAQGLKKVVPQGIHVVAPDYQPECYSESIEQLSKLIQDTSDECLLIGTSMGGYYGLILAQQYYIPTLLVNPCFDPASMLSKYLEQPAMNWVTNQPIVFTQSMLDAFEAPSKASLTARSKTLAVMVGRQDDVIPPDQQISYCQQLQISYEITNWGHRVGDVDQLANRALSLISTR